MNYIDDRQTTNNDTGASNLKTPYYFHNFGSKIVLWIGFRSSENFTLIKIKSREYLKWNTQN